MTAPDTQNLKLPSHLANKLTDTELIALISRIRALDTWAETQPVTPDFFVAPRYASGEPSERDVTYPLVSYLITDWPSNLSTDLELDVTADNHDEVFRVAVSRLREKVAQWAGQTEMPLTPTVS